MFSHRKHSIFVIFIFVILQGSMALAVDPWPVGWATYNDLGLDGTTGGAGGATVTVTTAEQLEYYIGRTEPYIILIQGTITMPQKQVTPNKSIIGTGLNPTIIGGFKIKRSHNVIIRNLIIKESGYDGISVEYDSHHVWIDHCRFSDCYDGLVDITHGCDYITVSWCRFSDHDHTCLLGHSDDNADEDIGHLKVTYHHNWFKSTDARNPRVRFSYLTHVFNNYYTGNNYGIASTCDAEVLVESCYFQSVKYPTRVGYGSSWDGDLVERNNIFVNCSYSPETRGTVPEPCDYYPYTLDPAADIPAIVSRGAGLFPFNDNDPPAPDPMTWVSVPAVIDGNAITMTATTAGDISGVEYFFTNETINDGSHNSGWQAGSTYIDTGLSLNTTYTYNVIARDLSDNYNETAPSDSASATTTSTPSDLTPPTPDLLTWAVSPAAISDDAITMTAATASDSSGVEYYFDNITDPTHDSGWQDSTIYTDANLLPDTTYTYTVIARDKSFWKNETVPSASESATTNPDSTAPRPDPMTWASPPEMVNASTIIMTATTATDDSGVEYYFENTTDPNHDSGWQDSPLYIDTGLAPSTTYTYTITARDLSPGYNQTIPSAPASATTGISTSQIFINFQPDGSNIPIGYNPDYGYAYGDRGSALYYGWNVDHSEHARERGAHPDQRFDTLIHFRSGGVWEIEVPNGEYDVEVTTGDPLYDSTCTINVEGVNYWNALYMNINQFSTLTKTIQVSDGKLTIDQGTAAEKATRICYVIITPVIEDQTPPIPNPMSWHNAPNAVSSSEITMTASTAYDESGVEYYFDCITPGGHDSDWQDSPTYTDTGLTNDTSYTYQVKARDKSINQNETAYSDPLLATTLIYDCIIELYSDLDSNCQVDFFDYAVFANAWAAQSPSADLNGDTYVDFLDFAHFVTEWLICNRDPDTECRQ